MMSNVPEIRFKGFANAWERCKLGEVGEFKNGMNFEKDAMGQGYPFVNLQDIFGRTVLANIGLGLAESTEKQRVEYSLKKGDMLFIRSSVKPAGVGETALVAEDLPNTTYSGFIIRFRALINFDDQFKRFVFTTKSIRHQIMTKATSSANTNINQDSLGLLELNFPSISEQKMLGEFFRTLDTTITLHKRKLDGLRELKRGYLQQMFPLGGERVPRVRFSGFSGDWQGRKLGEIGKTQSGVGFSEAEQGGMEGVPFFKVSDMNLQGNENIMLSSNNYVSATQIESRRWNVITTVPAILFAKVGAALLLDRKRLVYEPFLIDNNLMAYLFDETWDIDFAKALFEIIDLSKYAQVGALPSFNGSDIEAIEIIRPPHSEQTAIGNFFRTLDEQITAKAQKTEQLKRLKAAYLQKMFV